MFTLPVNGGMTMLDTALIYGVSLKRLDGSKLIGITIHHLVEDKVRTLSKPLHRLAS